MKPIGYVVAIPKFHGLWTTLICVALMSGGWHLMHSLRDLDAAADEMEASFRFPAAIYSAKHSPARLQYLQQQAARSTTSTPANSRSETNGERVE